MSASPWTSADEPFVVNYGGGVDSTAMLIEFVRRGIRPDLILFADVGSEKPETYDFLERFSAWLVDRGFPPVTIVRRYGTDEGAMYGERSRPSKTGSGYRTIEENCLQNQTLPSLAFGRKSCSLKWKAEPMDKWIRERWAPAAEAWGQGLRPVKAIGYDSGPADSRRCCGKFDDPAELERGFRYVYPLRDWAWDRERCESEIAREGLEVPVKSACFFCPASKPDELRQMAVSHPELLRRAVELEDNARPSLGTVEGLWRRATKTRPGSWRKFVEAEGLLEAPGQLELGLAA